MKKNNSQYRLIALDMDGTLLNSQHQVSAENRKWISQAEAAGVVVMLSTGRGHQSVLPYVEQLNLKSPIVLVNGSEIWRSPEELYQRTVMSADMIRKLRQVALDWDVWYWAYSVEEVMNRENWPASEDDVDWLKFGFYSENKSKLDSIHKTLVNWNNLEITNSDVTNLELNPQGISKGAAVEQVCGLLGLQMSQVIAVGDSINDLSMIRSAGLGIAMGNGQSQVKEAADAIAPLNNDDAIAFIIQKYIFHNKGEGNQ